MFHFKLTYEEVDNKGIGFCHMAKKIIQRETFKHIKATKIGVCLALGDFFSDKKSTLSEDVEDVGL